MSKKILYIHGFNSAGGGHKSQELQKMFPDWQVLSPTFDYKDPAGVQKKLDSLVRTQRVNAVMGTSLGGFFAIYCAKKHKLPAMVINPAFRPSETLAKHLGKQKNYVTKEEYQFTATDLAKFADFERKVFDGTLKYNYGTRTLPSTMTRVEVAGAPLPDDWSATADAEAAPDPEPLPDGTEVVDAE